jgi:hypothetical protein
MATYQQSILIEAQAVTDVGGCEIEPAHLGISDALNLEVVAKEIVGTLVGSGAGPGAPPPR